uniref:QWRF motif-containing protein 2-like n=1 Tax=Nelumbo nucifera TaxID=4432 RepID=A0A822Z537_NELNU|nr:TPA_asm: hypothetical protein HUJ06_015797 [Nelumbo nucifera]
MMVAAFSANASPNPPNPKTSSQQEATHQNQTRPPLLPSERDNGVVGPRRPKSREITSRYMSPFTSTTSTSSSSFRRCPSPLVSRPTTSMAASTPLPSVIKRSQSAERRRPVTPRPTTPLPDSRTGNAAEVSVASKMLFTSTRSLSVSFQGESFSLPISKTKATPTPNLSNARKATPERRKTTLLRGKVDGAGAGGGDQTENSRPIDQHRWPGRARQVNPLTRSLDCTGDKKKLLGSGTVVRALQQSMIEEGRRASFDGRLHRDSNNVDLVKTVQLAPEANLANGSILPSDLTASDTESVSSGSTSGAQECNGVSRARTGPRGISVPARFWQETNSRLRRLQDPSSPLSTNTGLRTTAPPKLIPSKKSLSDSPISSPRTVSSGSSRALSSPLRGHIRPASPSKLMTNSTSSPSRGMPSPSRMRNVATATLSGHSINTPSILSFSVDVRRGKMGENRIVDAHLLRLLYNRHLQWRFVNARADAALLLQRLTAEMAYLEEWSLLDRDHFTSLSGAIEALKASTLRLPVVCGAKADIQNVKDAVGSAVDVMQAMASSICSLLSKVDEMNSLVAELANVTAQERALISQCKDLLCTLAAMQVKDCSLRTHILQLKRVPTSLTTQV